MPTSPTPPSYWWLTVRIDACRTRDERVAAASGDDAVRMWRELHPNVEVIHVRPVPKLSVTTLLPCPFCGSTNLRYDFCASQGCMVCDDCDAVGPSDPRAADPICDDDAAVAAWNRRAALADKPVADGPAVPEGREPASVVGEPSDEELLELIPEGFTAPVCAAAAIQANVLSFARAVLARFGNHSPDATKMVGPAEGDVAELVAWLRGAIRDSKRQALATSAADMLVQLCSGWVVPTVEQFAPVPVPVSERLPEPSVKVLAHYFNDLGKWRTICAIWVAAKTRSDSYGDDDFTEYDEESDTFYWPEGWYEAIENWDDLGHVKVDEGEVIYWQPLPKWPVHVLPLPKGEAK